LNSQSLAQRFSVYPCFSKNPRYSVHNALNQARTFVFDLQLPIYKITQLPNSSSIATTGNSIGANQISIGADDNSIGTNGSSIGTSVLSIGTKNTSATDNPNVFNASVPKVPDWT
jgi:hypothetical protein